MVQLRRTIFDVGVGREVLMVDLWIVLIEYSNICRSRNIRPCLLWLVRISATSSTTAFSSNVPSNYTTYSHDLCAHNDFQDDLEIPGSRLS